MGRLDGKVALVTGGSNGIGRACALRFAEEGADVVVVDVADESGAATVGEIEAHGRRALYQHAEASSPAEIHAATERAVDELGRLDVVVTAAGVSSAAYRSTSDVSEQVRNMGATFGGDELEQFCSLTVEEWERVLEVNLTGTLLAVQAAGRRMAALGNGGSIITIASIAAKVPEAGTPSYAVSKAGVWMLTKHAARAFVGAGIRVNSIGPGFIATNMTAIVRAVPELEDRFMAQIPMGRMGTAMEVANTALFLASDESSYFTGEILHPDGGFYTE